MHVIIYVVCTTTPKRRGKPLDKRKVPLRVVEEKRRKEKRGDEKRSKEKRREEKVV